MRWTVRVRDRPSFWSIRGENEIVLRGIDRRRMRRFRIGPISSCLLNNNFINRSRQKKTRRERRNSLQSSLAGRAAHSYTVFIAVFRLFYQSVIIGPNLQRRTSLRPLLRDSISLNLISVWSDYTDFVSRFNRVMVMLHFHPPHLISCVRLLELVMEYRVNV